MNSLEIVFSSSPSTKSHCDCDERFFNCLRWATIFDKSESPPYILFSFVESDHDLILREVQSNKADAVGKLFFNFLKIQVNLINPKHWSIELICIVWNCCNNSVAVHGKGFQAHAMPQISSYTRLWQKSRRIIRKWRTRCNKKKRRPELELGICSQRSWREIREAAETVSWVGTREGLEDCGHQATLLRLGRRNC